MEQCRKKILFVRVQKIAHIKMHFSERIKNLLASLYVRPIRHAWMDIRDRCARLVIARTDTSWYPEASAENVRRIGI